MSIVNHDHREKWDPSDVAALKAMYQDDVPVETIAQHMGRTPASVKSALYRNSIKRR